MEEFRLDVFDRLPEGLGANAIVTLCGRDPSAVPKGFPGLVDAGEADGDIGFRRIRSVHDFEGTPSAGKMAETLNHGTQEVSKMACMCGSFRDLREIYRASRMVSRAHVLLGMGEIGTVTRVRQAVLGNMFSFGYVGEPTAPGQLSAERMAELGDDCAVLGVMGHPLGHSLSPAMQNAALRAAGINGIYLRFDSPDAEAAGDVIRDYRMRGMNVTIPFKMDMMCQMDSVDDAAEALGALNTVVNDDGRLKGYNTDVDGVDRAFELSGKRLSEHGRVLIFGSGGAARAAAYAARRAGCRTEVLGRNREAVAKLCRDIGAEATDTDSLKGYDAVINCTPIGMREDSPYMFDLGTLPAETTVMDCVYNRETRLVKAARSKGCRVADGRDMLVGQGARSFELWFGVRPDEGIMKGALR